MTKERVNISIEKELMEKVRQNIPNLSSFVEEALNHYFGYANGTIPIGDIQELTSQIGKLQLQIELINKSFDLEEERKKAEEFEKDKAWRFLWMKYEKTLMPEETLINNAMEATGLNRDTLEDMLDSLYSAINFEDLIIDTEYWSNIEKWYNKKNME